jgi:hypothetical protein
VPDVPLARTINLGLEFILIYQCMIYVYVYQGNGARANGNEIAVSSLRLPK